MIMKKQSNLKKSNDKSHNSPLTSKTQGAVAVLSDLKKTFFYTVVILTILLILNFVI